MMEIPTPTVHLEDLDMPHTTFDRPDLSAFTRLDGLGLEVWGQRVEKSQTVLACRITGGGDGAGAQASHETR